MLPAQVNPLPNTWTDLYTVPIGKRAVISTIVICNCGTNTSGVRVSVAINGDVHNIKQYIVYNLGVPNNNPFSFTYGLMMNAGDVLRVWAELGDVAFNAFGEEEAMV
jgi:hypothetical protein